MNKVRNGDLEKLGLLFERYKRVLFNYFYGMNRNAQLSEDLVQNVFLRVMRYRSGFRGEGSFKYWIFHIARNVNADHHRKNKNVRYLDVQAHSEHLDSGEGADDNISRREDLDRLNQAIQHLSAEQREIIILSKIEEMRYADIAKHLDLTEGAVKVRVFRAMNELKRILNPNDRGNERSGSE